MFEIIYDPLQNVELVLCTFNNFPTVELVKPYNSKSPINNYLKKNDEMIYHVCYEISDTGKRKLKYQMLYFR